MTATENDKPRLGIYFGLKEDDYHADPALGSTDIRVLFRSGPDYWWNSPKNPFRKPRKPTDAKSFGTALHKRVLEGTQAFDAKYIRRPDDPEDASSSEKGALTKETNAKAAKLGKLAVHGDDFDRIIVASALITHNPDLATAFTGGASEVSVFWEENGVRLKARWDYLKPRGVADLKGIANTYDKEFSQACRDAIARYRYDMQATHYLRGRAHLPALIKQGLVYGATSAEEPLIDKVAAAKEWAFVFVFFQSEDAPVTWGTILSPENPIVKYAENQVIAAIERYAAFQAEYGDQMWLLREPVQELSLDEMPVWFGR